jgi:hypothetical protein
MRYLDIYEAYIWENVIKITLLAIVLFFGEREL